MAPAWLHQIFPWCFRGNEDRGGFGLKTLGTWASVALLTNNITSVALVRSLFTSFPIDRNRKVVNCPLISAAATIAAIVSICGLGDSYASHRLDCSDERILSPISVGYRACVCVWALLS
jgi:hypothetical protein